MSITLTKNKHQATNTLATSSTKGSHHGKTSKAGIIPTLSNGYNLVNGPVVQLMPPKTVSPEASAAVVPSLTRAQYLVNIQKQLAVVTPAATGAFSNNSPAGAGLSGSPVVITPALNDNIPLGLGAALDDLIADMNEAGTATVYGEAEASTDLNQAWASTAAGITGIASGELAAQATLTANADTQEASNLSTEVTATNDSFDFNMAESIGMSGVSIGASYSGNSAASESNNLTSINDALEQSQHNLLGNGGMKIDSAETEGLQDLMPDNTNVEALVEDFNQKGENLSGLNHYNFEKDQFENTGTTAFNKGNLVDAAKASANTEIAVNPTIKKYLESYSTNKKMYAGLNAKLKDNPGPGNNLFTAYTDTPRALLAPDVGVISANSGGTHANNANLDAQATKDEVYTKLNEVNRKLAVNLKALREGTVVGAPDQFTEAELDLINKMKGVNSPAGLSLLQGATSSIDNSTPNAANLKSLSSSIHEQCGSYNNLTSSGTRDMLAGVANKTSTTKMATINAVGSFNRATKAAKTGTVYNVSNNKIAIGEGMRRQQFWTNTEQGLNGLNNLIGQQYQTTTSNAQATASEQNQIVGNDLGFGDAQLQAIGSGVSVLQAQASTIEQGQSENSNTEGSVEQTLNSDNSTAYGALAACSIAIPQ